MNEDKKTLSKIYSFNWNQGNSGLLTVEEIIMTQLTNDIGEFATPHFTHIVFSEFKKFMFLNKLQLEKDKNDEKDELAQRQIKDFKESYVGLFAPPILDSVWITIMSLNTFQGKFRFFTSCGANLNTSIDDVSGNNKSIYQKFCQEIFGVYMERPVIKEDEQEVNYLAERRYELTINCLHSFKSLLDPFKNLWPEYSDENYLSDYHSTVWVTTSDLAKLSRKIDDDIKEKKIGLDLTAWGDLTNNVIESFQKFQHTEKLVIKNYGKDKFKTFVEKKKPTIIKKIYGKFEVYSLGEKTLATRLQRKYMLDADTAIAWITEARKYITILLCETDPENTDHCFPPSVAECVIQTYAELGRRYADFSKSMFGKLLLSESHHMMKGDLENYKKRYATTLEKYKKYYGDDAPKLWETVENRFSNHINENGAGLGDEDGESEVFCDPNVRVAVNIHRLIAAKVLLKEKKDHFNSQKITSTFASNETSVKETATLYDQMQQAKTNNHLFKWRKGFPHCSNVYFRESTVDEKLNYISNPYENDWKNANIFRPGGILILPNTYDSAITYEENLAQKLSEGFYEAVKMSKLSDLTLDHLADGAIKHQSASFKNHLDDVPAKKMEEAKQ
jgi:hypothetical protein